MAPAAPVNLGEVRRAGCLMSPTRTSKPSAASCARRGSVGAQRSIKLSGTLPVSGTASIHSPYEERGGCRVHVADASTSRSYRAVSRECREPRAVRIEKKKGTTPLTLNRRTSLDFAVEPGRQQGGVSRGSRTPTTYSSCISSTSRDLAWR